MEDRVQKYFADPRKIKEVRPLEDHSLLLTFDNGEKRKYSMEHELTGVFEILKDKEKFYRVFINEVGNVAWDIDDDVDSSVHWENQIDLCKDMLYMESVPIPS
ncbi:MAG: DUF2442 domain-containing protein [Lachnospiraceae bacterium]|nr:DUF2442 domain-containing protein [Lachnospiraceae bacterium]